MRGITAYELIQALKADLSAVEVEIDEKAANQKSAKKQRINPERHLKLLHELDELYLKRSRIRDSLSLVGAKYKELNE